MAARALQSGDRQRSARRADPSVLTGRADLSVLRNGRADLPPSTYSHSGSVTSPHHRWLGLRPQRGSGPLVRYGRKVAHLCATAERSPGLWHEWMNGEEGEGPALPACGM